MAQQALPPGAVRRRAAFGLLDADGWTWAGLKATFWFLFIIFMLGYIPNLGYFFTVGSTVEVGYNFASIVNLCPAENEDLPCPVPTGAVQPWQTSPAELALPEGRFGASVFQSGSTIYLVGGETANEAVADVLVTKVSEDGNFAPWIEGPALPEPRTDAALGVYLGTPFLMGGLDASGQTTDTVFKGIVQDGLLSGWELADGENGTDPLTLPQPLSGAAVVPGTSGFVLIGGRDADRQPVDNVYVAWVDEASSAGRLLAWQPLENLAIPEPRADAVASAVGDFIYVVGGEGPTLSATDSVFRLELVDREPATDEAGGLQGWAVISDEEHRLPGPRTEAATFHTGSAVYVIGGVDDGGALQSTMLWAVPDTETGDIPGGWHHLEQIDLPMTLADAPAAGVGTHVFAFGGRTGEGTEITDGSLRAGLSPAPPFFQLGIAGATLPALGIGGEVGQQLGYINAMTVGIINFAILILIGLAYSHQRTTKRFFVWLSRGRLKMPPEEEYGS